MIGPLPAHRPLRDWEARINTNWIIRDLHDEARECMSIILSNAPFEARMHANTRRNECYRLIIAFEHAIDRSAA